MIDGKSIGVLLGSMAATVGLLFLSKRKSKSFAETAGDLDMTDAELIDYAKQRYREFDFQSFVTKKGQSYRILPNKQLLSVRVGASTFLTNPPETLAKDPHFKKPSIMTYFIKPSDAQRIGQHRPLERGEKTVLMFTNGAILPIIERADGKLEAVWSDFEKPITYTTIPMVGLSPLELWEQKVIEGKPLYEGWHSGDTIVKVSRR